MQLINTVQFYAASRLLRAVEFILAIGTGRKRVKDSRISEILSESDIFQVTWLSKQIWSTCTLTVNEIFSKIFPGMLGLGFVWANLPSTFYTCAILMSWIAGLYLAFRILFRRKEKFIVTVTFLNVTYLGSPLLRDRRIAGIGQVPCHWTRKTRCACFDKRTHIFSTLWNAWGDESGSSQWKAKILHDRVWCDEQRGQLPCAEKSEQCDWKGPRVRVYDCRQVDFFKEQEVVFRDTCVMWMWTRMSIKWG